MADFKDISVIIPVREGSSRIKNKIFLPFYNGMNILEWKINQVKQFHSNDRIFISSNSIKVRSIAENMGVCFLEREDYLSVGHLASFSEVITGIVKKIPTSHFAWITVVVPLMSPAEYKAAFEKYLSLVVKEKKFDSLVTVNLLKEYLWSEKSPLNYEANRNHTISQQLPNIYRVTNGLYVRDCKSTLADGYFLGSNPLKFTVSKIAGIDMDEQEDYEIALALKSLYKDF